MDKFNDFSALKALKKDLEEKESSAQDALTCYWTPGPAGVTIVTIR